MNAVEKFESGMKAMMSCLYEQTDGKSLEAIHLLEGLISYFVAVNVEKGYAKPTLDRMFDRIRTAAMAMVEELENRDEKAE